MTIKPGISSLIVLGGVATCWAATDGGEPGIRVSERDGGLLFSEADTPILFYRRDPHTLNRHTRAHYIHPLYGLDGEVLTEESPKDHPHHWGVFWAWHQLWIGKKRIGDPWVQEDAAWHVRRAETIPGPGGSLVLDTDVEWTSPAWVDDAGAEKPIVFETTQIRIYPAEGNHRLLDFTIGLRAAEEGVRIGGAENKKEYGGFSVRIPMPEDLRFTDADGGVTPQGPPVGASPWMDFTASFAGKERPPSGLAVLCHPTTPGFPQRWILRSRGSMQNPVYPGRKAVTLPTAEPLVLRYRLVIHRGNAHQAGIEALQRQYAGVE